MKERLIPRSHARDIAELAVDLSEKAHDWKARALAAEAQLSLSGPYSQMGKEVLQDGKHFADAADVLSAARIAAALNALENRADQRLLARVR